MPQQKESDPHLGGRTFSGASTKDSFLGWKKMVPKGKHPPISVLSFEKPPGALGVWRFYTT